MYKSQLGLGWFGSLIILAIAIGAGYYAYQGVSGGNGTPSCAVAHNTCLQTCRRTATEAAAAQGCQLSCQREADTCAREAAPITR